MTPARKRIDRITAIDVVGSDPNLRSIKVNGRAVARLPVADVDRIGLRPGVRWSPSMRAAVESTVQQSKARAAALAILARRAMSSVEVAERLQRKGIATDIAAKTVRQLARDRWIDDEALARQVVESALRKGPIGSRALVARLERRGIGTAISIRVVKASLATADPRDDAVKLARQQATRNARGGPASVGRRVAAALARRGFDEDVIDEALRMTGFLVDGEA